MVWPKVAFITPGSFPIPSPGSSSVERVVEHVVPRLKHAADVRIYGRTAKGLPRVGSLQGVPCFRFPAVSKSAYVREVARSLRSFQPNVVVVENRPTYVLKLRRQLPQARIWLSLQSLTFVAPPYLQSTALRACLREAERIVVNSKFLRDELARRVPEISDRLRVVHLGVELGRFHSQYGPEGTRRREQLRKARGWQDRFVVMFMGRILPRKGVHHLLRILPDLVKANPSVLLVVVGSPYYGSHRLTAYARRLRRIGKAWSRHIQFVSYVPYEQVPDWFVTADAAVVPSDEREAFGLVNVEAMACGVPVVATGAGGITEIVTHGVTGFLAAPARLREELRDWLIQLFKHPEMTKGMGYESRQRVERQFSWERTAERWSELLRESGG